jgi:hypothetical protein
MSRNHERAYRLLAERVRLPAPARYALYAAMAALIGSGVWWMAVHFAPTDVAAGGDDLTRLEQEALALKVHGATAFGALLALGAMGAHHVPRGWTLRRNRISGSAVIAGFALLIVTGYALYYLVGDASHAPVSVLHWAVGIALAPMLIVHIVVGHRSRGKGPDRGVEPRQQRIDQPPPSGD